MQQDQKDAFARRMKRIESGKGHTLGKTIVGVQDDGRPAKLKSTKRQTRTAAALRLGMRNALMQLSFMLAGVFAYSHFIGF